MLLQHIIRGVLRETAAADGGGDAAPGASTSALASKPSVHERLKAFLSDSDSGDSQARQSRPDPSENEIDTEPDDRNQTKEPEKAKAAPKQAAADHGSPDGEDSSADGVDLTSITELADQTGLSLDRLMDLSVPARVDGKDAKATIRELIKSFQLDGHLTNKLQTHASEVAAWKTQQAQQQQEYQQNLQRMDAGLQVAQRMLQGEFAQVNWEQLQQSDPAQFAQVHLSFQQRQAQLDHVAQMLGKERQTQQAKQAEEHKSWLQEQKQLLEAKLPEWADEKTRKAAISEMVDVVGKVYGITADDIGKLTDHRDILVLNDALKWQKLQQSKTTVLNKVRTAPKLLKPGSAQSQESRAGLAVTEARARAKKTGNVRDTARLLRAAGIV